MLIIVIIINLLNELKTYKTIITFGINWKIVFIYNGIKDVRHKENYCLNYCDFIMDSYEINVPTALINVFQLWTQLWIRII